MFIYSANCKITNSWEYWEIRHEYIPCKYYSRKRKIGSIGVQSPENVGISVFETIQEEIDSGWMNTESISKIENLEIPENLDN